jgi:hypothetical protein
MKNIDTKLITPSAALSGPFDWLETMRPTWWTTWAWVNHSSDDEGPCVETPLLCLVVGKKHRSPVIVTTIQCAFLLEVTRLGHTVATNSNFGDNPRVYVKLCFRDAPADNLTLARVFADAGTNEQTKLVYGDQDLRLENLYKLPAGKPNTVGWATTRRHALRLANEREASGTMPEGLTAKDYIENLDALWAALSNEGAALKAGAQ